MCDPYITVTLELSGYDAEALEAFHDTLRAMVRNAQAHVSYAEVTIGYQDQGPPRPEMVGEDEDAAETWYEG